MTLAIDVHGVSKRYRLGEHRRGGYQTLREALSTGARNIASRFATLGRKRHAHQSADQSFWALRDVSFRVDTGEAIGIIGCNGAGKSTLLKILSRITEPTEGRAQLRGTCGSLLEVGTGFHPELTGRENVFLNGTILGMTRTRVLKCFDDIVGFAELEQFIDTPVKRYSSGMYVRLAFAVSAYLEPDILIIDEVLAVGDIAFQRKCFEHAKQLGRCGKTVLLVSHNMFAVKALCDRAIFLSRGRVTFDGPVGDAIRRYEAESESNTVTDVSQSGADQDVHVLGMDLLDSAGRPCTAFNHGDHLRLRIRYETDKKIDGLNFVVAFLRSDGVFCCNHVSELDGLRVPTANRAVVELCTPPLKMIADHYRIHLLIRSKDYHLYAQYKGPSFHVRGELSSSHFGVYYEGADWEFVSDRDCL